ncbi:MAG: GNAT family protein [Vicingaceae bacterium]|jgi:RimJ/RimL family protein N-acetyltransferase
MENFDFNKEYVLENDFVRLSPLRIEHAEILLDIANEDNIWLYSFVKGDGIENLTKYILSTIKNRKSNKDYPFIVFDKVKNEFVGSTRFCEFIPVLDSIRIGYTWYGKKFRGTGLNKHCKYLMFQFAFEKVGIERIGLSSYIENKISIAAIESVGCKKEGVFRGLLPAINSNGRTDAVMFSILKSEWLNKVKTELNSKLKKHF